MIGSRETLDGLKAGLQNRQISDRLTLKDVQLGPIAWQIYVGDNADLTIENSTINEIGFFGRNAKVPVERSVLQLAVLAALGPGSSLDIRDSDIWNQTIEVANKGKVSIAGSRVHGMLFHTRDSGFEYFHRRRIVRRESRALHPSNDGEHRDRSAEVQSVQAAGNAARGGSGQCPVRGHRRVHVGPLSEPGRPC